VRAVSKTVKFLSRILAKAAAHAATYGLANDIQEYRCDRASCRRSVPVLANRLPEKVGMFDNDNQRFRKEGLSARMVSPSWRRNRLVRRRRLINDISISTAMHAVERS